MKDILAGLLTVTLLAILAFTAVSFQQRTDQHYISGKVEHIDGEAWLQRKNKEFQLSLSDQISRLDHITTKESSKLTLLMEDGSRIAIGPNTHLYVEKYSSPERNIFNSSIRLLLGQAHFYITKLRTENASFDVRTSTATLGVRGTEFLTTVPSNDQSTAVELYEGKLHLAAISGNHSESELTAGQQATITTDGNIDISMITSETNSQKKAYAGNKAGDVWIVRNGEQKKLHEGNIIKQGDYVVTSNNSRVEILLNDALHLFGHKIYMKANSAIFLKNLNTSPLIQMLWGDARFSVGKAEENHVAMQLSTKTFTLNSSEAAQISLHVDLPDSTQNPDWASLKSAAAVIDMESGNAELLNSQNGSRTKLQSGSVLNVSATLKEAEKPLPSDSTL